LDLEVFSLDLTINARLSFDLRQYAEEPERLVQELSRIAVTDRLTGIFNRMKMEDVLAVEMARARRYDRPLSAILIDVDRFKQE
jgi:PleD family two-component response regulator